MAVQVDVLFVWFMDVWLPPLQLMQQTTLNDQAEADHRPSTVSLRKREGEKNIFATLVVPNPLSLFKS